MGISFSPSSFYLFIWSDDLGDFPTHTPEGKDRRSRLFHLGFATFFSFFVFIQFPVPHLTSCFYFPFLAGQVRRPFLSFILG